MFKDWYKRADTYVSGLTTYQRIRTLKLLQKAYEAGFKHGQKEATIIAEKTIDLLELLRSKKP